MDPKIISKKNRKQESYLQQPTKPLLSNRNFYNIQKIYPNSKAEKKTEQKRKADFESDRYSKTKKEVGLRNSGIETSELIEK